MLGGRIVPTNSQRIVTQGKPRADSVTTVPSYHDPTRGAEKEDESTVPLAAYTIFQSLEDPRPNMFVFVWQSFLHMVRPEPLSTHRQCVFLYSVRDTAVSGPLRQHLTRCCLVGTHLTAFMTNTYAYGCRRGSRGRFQFMLAFTGGERWRSRASYPAGCCGGRQKVPFSTSQRPSSS